MTARIGDTLPSLGDKGEDAEYRFGPDITSWRNCASVKEFMYSGLLRSMGFYITSGGIMVLLQGACSLVYP